MTLLVEQCMKQCNIKAERLFLYKKDLAHIKLETATFFDYFDIWY